MKTYFVAINRMAPWSGTLVKPATGGLIGPLQGPENSPGFLPVFSRREDAVAFADGNADAVLTVAKEGAARG